MALCFNSKNSPLAFTALSSNFVVMTRDDENQSFVDYKRPYLPSCCQSYDRLEGLVQHDSFVKKWAVQVKFLGDFAAKEILHPPA
jgi:hypothetical protein